MKLVTINDRSVSSAGEFRFPNEEAEPIALDETQAYCRNGGQCHVIFYVFGKNWLMYDRLMNKQVEEL